MSRPGRERTRPGTAHSNPPPTGFSKPDGIVIGGLPPDDGSVGPAGSARPASGVAEAAGSLLPRGPGDEVEPPGVPAGPPGGPPSDGAVGVGASVGLGGV